MPEVLEASGTGLQEAAARLLESHLAVSLKVRRWRVYKPLSRGHRGRAAGELNANEHALVASKKLLNFRHPRYRECVAAANEAHSYWVAMTVPYTEKGVRLLPAAREAEYDEGLAERGLQLRQKAEALEAEIGAVAAEARQLLGPELFAAVDYEGVAEKWGLDAAKPPLAPDERLRATNPRAWAERVQALEARLQQSVVLWEQTAADELAKLVAGLAEKLKERPDGTRPAVRGSALGALRDFFAQFRALNVREGSSVEEAIGQAEAVLLGTTAGDLRESPALRTEVRDGMAEVLENLTPLISSAARRRLPAGCLGDDLLEG